MAIEFGVMAYLGSLGGLTAIVPASRMHCGEIPPESQLPAISILRTATNDIVSMAGEAGIANAAVHVDCVADTYVNSRNIVELIRDGAEGRSTNGFSGAMGAYTVEGCFIEDESDLDPLLFPELSLLKRYVARVQLSIWYTETTSSI